MTFNTLETTKNKNIFQETKTERGSGKKYWGFGHRSQRVRPLYLAFFTNKKEVSGGFKGGSVTLFGQYSRKKGGSVYILGKRGVRPPSLASL